MIEKIIRLLVIGIVLAIVYYIATMIVGLLSLPPIVLVLALVILLLVFVAYLLRVFNIKL